MSAPASRNSSGVSVLTDPAVPTGMNAGVSTSPCAVRDSSGARGGPGIESFGVKREGHPVAASGPNSCRGECSAGNSRGAERAGQAAACPSAPPSVFCNFLLFMPLTARRGCPFGESAWTSHRSRASPSRSSDSASAWRSACSPRASCAYCRSHKDPLPHLAARFAAKEAASKALGTGMSERRGLDADRGAPAGRPRAACCTFPAPRSSASDARRHVAPLAGARRRLAVACVVIEATHEREQGTGRGRAKADARRRYARSRPLARARPRPAVMRKAAGVTPRHAPHDPPRADRESRRDRGAHHPHAARTRHDVDRDLQRARPRRAARADGRRGLPDRRRSLARELPEPRARDRHREAREGRRDSSRLRVLRRERDVRGALRARRTRVHRARQRNHRGARRQARGARGREGRRRAGDARLGRPGRLARRGARGGEARSAGRSCSRRRRAAAARACG